MGHFRTLFRLSRFLLHVLHACALVGLLFPWIDENKRAALKQRWSHQLVHLLGVRLRLAGDLPTLPQGLLVANHISFLDIFVLNALAPTTFVSKDDVRHWPVAGWLSANTSTLFLARGSRSAAQKARQDIVDQLRAGHRVAVFPEGTTTFGDTVLPFHSALLQAAVDAGTPVTPLMLRYCTPDGAPSTAPAYIDDITLFQCLRSIAVQKRLYVEVAVLPALCAVEHDRRQLSAHAHKLIAHALAKTLTLKHEPA